MGKGYGSSRRVGLIGAIVVGLMLALAVPSIALAVNTASFKSPVPASTSWINVAKPTISLFGYDRYGVKASGISMWVAGRRVTPTFTYNNLGKKSFRLSYAVPAALPDGAIRVTVKVKDARGKLSSTSWLFNVDTIAPVTVSSGALPTSPGLGAVSMSATDGGSGVKHTYWTLDNGAAMEGAILVTLDAGSHHVDYWSVDIAGNVETPKTLSTTVGGAPAIMHKSATGALSSACTTCHRDNLATVHEHAEFGGCGCHTASFLTARMAVFMAPGATPAECVSCHAGAHAAHGFDGKVSGHNTTTFGTVGAYTKWDGSEGIVVKDSTNSTITQDWPLPTAGVFWSQVDPTKADPTTDSPTFIFGAEVAAKVRTDVGWDSVVVCQDCHTGLDGAMGPQGANMGEVGLDPAFPDDWKTAQITSFDPTGMRSIATTQGSDNRFYAKRGSKIWPPEGVVGTGTVQRISGRSDTTITVYEGGFYEETTTPNGNARTGYSPGDIEGRYICQKCHKLATPYQGVSLAGNSRGWRSNNYAGMGFSNEAHMEHHADTISGQANCISCHIGVPHGWKRPRLLVYESDPAPYKVDQFPLATPVTANGKTYANGGNWKYFPGTVDGRNFNGAPGSSHLEAVNAASTAHKVEGSGVAEEFAPFDAQNAAVNAAGGYFWLPSGWSKWSTTSLGNLWHADTNVWTIEGAEGTHEIQNNCNACTATGATHGDPSLGGTEGFTPATSSPVPTTPGNWLAPGWE